MAKKGIVESINSLRAVASPQYIKEVPLLNEDSAIEVISTPLLNYPNLLNEFCNHLVQKIAYTQLMVKLFNNPLKELEGDNIPLGTIGEEIYINPAKGRKYDISDFEGLLKQYEIDTKVQYNAINLDYQYPATIIRQELKKAFTSWSTLENYISNITTSLYNGAYIDQYNLTKNLVTNAYRENAVQIDIVKGIDTKELAEEFIEKARAYFLNFQSPSTKYNAWHKVGGYGRDIITWSNPDDIYFLIRNDILAKIDVQVLAKAFNIDSTKLLGHIRGVDNFDIVDKNYNVVYDGSNIIAQMCDKAWFRIKEQDTYIDDFKNANNRSIQYYLNVIKMYKYSYFANAVCFATKMPDVNVTEMQFKEKDTSIELKENEEKTLTLLVTPPNATQEITFKSDHDSDLSVTKIDDRSCTIKGLKSTQGDQLCVITAEAGNISTTINVTAKGTE